MLEMNLIGRLVADPVKKTVTIRKTNEQADVANFRIAVNGNNGSVTYVNAVAWRGMADNVAKYLKKGSQVFVRGIPSATHFVANNTGHIYDNLNISVSTIQFLSPRYATQAATEPAAEAVPEAAPAEQIPVENPMTGVAEIPAPEPPESIIFSEDMLPF